MYRVCKHWLRDKIPSPRAQWDSIIITQYFAASNQCECTHHLCDWRNWKNPPASSVVTELWGLSQVSTRALVGHAEPQSATGKSNQCSKSFGGSWAPYCNDGGQITKNTGRPVRTEFYEIGRRSWCRVRRGIRRNNFFFKTATVEIYLSAVIYSLDREGMKNRRPSWRFGIGMCVICWWMG